ncbi:MAG: large conductance mechanosensitive channel protein MscL [Candidatus Nanopelagicales bacterium]
MLKGFREFLMRGNVIDLAVAVVIGAAFTAVVNGFTASLIDPIINKLVGGGVNGAGVTVLGITFDFAILINALITFIITAAVVYFVFVLPMQKITARYAKEKEIELEDSEKTVQLLEEIRDALKAQAKD